MRFADRGLRFAAWLVDAAIAGAVFTVFNPILYDRTPSFGFAVVLTVASLPAVFIYMVLFDGGKRGATPGKRITKMRVADVETGGPIGYWRATVRRLVYLLGGLCLYVGWIWFLFDAKRQAWHDKAARTYVIDERPRDETQISTAMRR